MWAELKRETPASVSELEAHRRKELREASEQRQAAHCLVVHLDACHLEALVKAARNSLDALKKRISTSAVVSSGNSFEFLKKKKTKRILNNDNENDTI